VRPVGEGSGPRAGEDVEAALLGAVDRLLAQGRSYTGLTVGTIADEAGVSRSAFYAAFADTAALAVRLIDVRTAELVDRARAWIESDGDRATLAPMVRELLAGFRRHADVLRTRQELGGTDAVVRGYWVGRLEGIADVLAHRLRRPDRDGTALDPAVTASWIVWGTERTLTIHIQTRPERSDDEVADGVAAAIWSAMHQPAP
jgi:AcrR family transcriptional regulator